MWVLKRKCPLSAGEHFDWFLGCELGGAARRPACSGARRAVSCGALALWPAAPPPRPLCARGALVPRAGRAGGGLVAVASCRLA